MTINLMAFEYASQVMKGNPRSGIFTDAGTTFKYLDI